MLPPGASVRLDLPDDPHLHNAVGFVTATSGEETKDGLVVPEGYAEVTVRLVDPDDCGIEHRELFTEDEISAVYC